jgi:ubiquinone/menaquinone biosynthesis C-methylase UbiE
MSFNALYTDLSGYYDLMCADIDYQTQSLGAIRLAQFFGNGGIQHLDLACGTGPHIAHFLAAGFECTGLDLNQPMLDLAKQRCPQAKFLRQNICDFQLEQQVDVITCFLYSLHYTADTQGLISCIGQVLTALKPGGVFCFNAVDKDLIDNQATVRHSYRQISKVDTTMQQHDFIFESGWFYSGQGDRQTLNVSIAKTSQGVTHQWQDQHPMVAVNFAQLRALLEPAFEVILLEHDYEKIVPWDQRSGNALVVCIKH